MRLYALVSALLFSTAVLPVCAQSDTHLSSDPLSGTYLQSVFWHGFVHGYEDGYHLGDVDLQMGRPARLLAGAPEFRNQRLTFGDKRQFSNGYSEGLRLGYLDAWNGIDFRAAEQVRRFVANPPTPPLRLEDLLTLEQGANSQTLGGH